MNQLTHALLGGQHIRDDFGQWTIVANAAGQDIGKLLADALIHDAAFEQPALHGRADAAGPADGVDGSEMMLVAFFGGQAAVQRHAQAGSIQGLLDVMRGQGIAGKEHL